MHIVFVYGSVIFTLTALEFFLLLFLVCVCVCVRVNAFFSDIDTITLPAGRVMRHIYKLTFVNVFVTPFSRPSTTPIPTESN